MSLKVKRGDLYFANLNNVVGSEQGGIRPVLVLQNNVGNKCSPTTIIAPTTTKKKSKSLPVHVFLLAKFSKLPQNSYVLLEQIRVIDKVRLMGKIGKLDEKTMKLIDDALKISVGLNSKYN